METTIYPVPVFREGLSKTKINELAEACISVVLEEGNPIQIAETLSAMEEFIKQVKKDSRFTQYVRDELIKENGKFTSPSGAKLEIAEVGVEYDFSACNDSELGLLQQQCDSADNALRLRKEFLKTIPPTGLTVVSQLTG